MFYKNLLGLYFGWDVGKWCEIGRLCGLSHRWLLGSYRCGTAVKIIRLPVWSISPHHRAFTRFQWYAGMALVLLQVLRMPWVRCNKLSPITLLVGMVLDRNAMGCILTKAFRTDKRTEGCRCENAYTNLTVLKTCNHKRGKQCFSFDCRVMGSYDGEIGGIWI